MSYNFANNQSVINKPSSFGLSPNGAALVSYIWIPVTSIIVLVTEKENRLVRFHAFQSLLLLGAALIIEIPAYFLMIILFVMNSTITSLLGSLFGLILGVFGLAIFVFMILALIKAFQGQIYKIPLIGDMADKWSN